MNGLMGVAHFNDDGVASKRWFNNNACECVIHNNFVYYSIDPCASLHSHNVFRLI